MGSGVTGINMFLEVRKEEVPLITKLYFDALTDSIKTGFVDIWQLTGNCTVKVLDATLKNIVIQSQICSREA